MKSKRVVSALFNMSVFGLFGLAACISLLTASQANASPITYNVDIISGASSITGTITTDGNTGVLAETDVTDWNLNISTVFGAKSEAFSMAGPASGNNSIFGGIFGHDLIASLTSLNFLFEDTVNEEFIGWGSTATVGNGLDNFNAEHEPPSGLFDISLADLGAVQFTPTTDVIGTLATSTTPLPAALPLFRHRPWRPRSARMA